MKYNNFTKEELNEIARIKKTNKNKDFPLSDNNHLIKVKNVVPNNKNAKKKQIRQ